MKIFGNPSKIFLKSFRLLEESDQNNNPFVEKVSQNSIKCKI